MDGGPGEALDDAVELEAAVEPVGEAGEIRLRMLGADMVVGAGDRCLDVAQAGVDPLERRPAAKSRSASRATSLLRKPLTTLSRSRLGLRSAVVSTAATIGVLPAAPRPRLPPGRSPPR